MATQPRTPSHESRLSALRLENSARCADWLRTNGPATIAEIADGTGLSRPTVADRLADLSDKGIATEWDKTDPEGQTGGRPAARFRFRSEAGFVAGIELGKHVDHLLLVNLSGGIVWSRAVGVIPAPSSERLERIRERLLAEIVDAGLDRADWRRLGLSLPGALSPDGIMRQSDLFPEWNGANVRDLASEVFGVPVVLENDVKAACIAEHRLGAAQGSSDVAFVLAWHQVAAGIMIDGALHRGRRFFAGEMGRLSVDPLALERDILWPSMPALVETTRAAESGDEVAIASIVRLADVIAEQVAPIVTTLDPDIVVVGGPAATASALFVDRVQSSIRAHLVSGAELTIRVAELGENGPALGSVLLALDETHRELFEVEPTTVSLQPREHAGIAG